jgi:hypothetical protein
MRALRLGVNIDHVATIRNARGGAYPDPVRAAVLSSPRICAKIAATSPTTTSSASRRCCASAGARSIWKWR